MHLSPNDLLQGRYRIQTLIAQGGMGAVYQAIDQRLGNTVALKQTLMSDPQLRAAFEREARLLAGLQHPALPMVSDHFTEGAGQFLVMQFIPGADLASLLARRGGPFPLDQVLPWAYRLLDALDYLHTQRPPIIHRDIKPQNLKLTPRGEIILLDFGLAKGSLGGGSTSGVLSLFGYTPQYAPIEQIQGAGTDPQTDLYSFGATFYQLLTGQVPPDALTRATALVAGQPDPLCPAHHVNPQLPAALGDLLQMTMAPSAAQRPISASALRSALGNVLSTPMGRSRPLPTPVVAEPSSAGQPTIALAQQGAIPTLQAGSRASKSKLWPVFGIAALSVGVLVAALFFLLQMWSGDASADQSSTAMVVDSKPTLVQFSPTSEASTPELVLGTSRTNPLPAGSIAQIESWAVQVTGVTRGDAAWHLLYETNTNNDLAPDGQEYVVVHTRAKSLLGSDANRGLYPQLTGDKLVAYTPTAAVVPNDRPDEYLAGNEFDIDFPYLVALGEGDLMLQVDDLGSALGVSPTFVVVDADASLEVDPALRSIKPTAVGVDPREPAAVAEKVTTEDFAVTVHEIVRGEAAFQRLLKANTFNDPPKEGMEYVSALVEVRSLATKDEMVMVTDTDFYSVIGDAEDVEATAITYTSVVEPEPQMHFYLYPGGTGVGWVTVAVPKNMQNVRLVFGPSFGSSDLNTRYFAIE